MEDLLTGPWSAALHLTAQHFEQARDAGVPIGKEVDVLELLLDAARYFALIEADRDDVDFVERELAGAIQRVADLGLEAALFADAAAREAGHEEIAAFDGGFDSARPVLSR